MFTPKFITSLVLTSDACGSMVALDDAESKHATVLRLNNNDEVRLYSLPTDSWFGGQINFAADKTASIQITTRLTEIEEAASRLRFFIGTPASSTMEYISQLLTEIGVNSIIFYRAERSQLSLDNAAITKIKSRLEKISISALKQSGVAKLPRIELLNRPLDEVCRDIEPRKTLLASLASDAPLPLILAQNMGLLESVQQSSKDADLLNVVIGPEGGLTDREEKLLLDRGCVPFSLGQSTLRVETACVVTAGILNGFFETETERRKVIDAVPQLQTSDIRQKERLP